MTVKAVESAKLGFRGPSCSREVTEGLVVVEPRLFDFGWYSYIRHNDPITLSKLNIS